MKISVKQWMQRVRIKGQEEEHSRGGRRKGEREREGDAGKED